jgi:peptide/nickel transport system permease protein
MTEVQLKAPGSSVNRFFSFMSRGTDRLRPLLSSLWQNPKSRSGIIILGCLVGLGVIGGIYTPYSPFAPAFADYLPPSWAHLLGTNYEGQDVLSQFMYGTGTSLLVGFSVGVLASIIGTVVGVVAGYYGKIPDTFLMRFVDVLLVIPGFPLLIVLSSYLPPTLESTIIVLAILSWPFMSRVIRSQTLSLKQKQFVMASKLSGMSNLKIMARDILPFLLPLIIINSIFIVVGAVVAQAGLAFFGLSDISSVNWGTMLYWFEAEEGILFKAWWWLLPPGIGIMLLGIGGNLLNNGLSETLGFGEKNSSR